MIGVKTREGSGKKGVVSTEFFVLTYLLTKSPLLSPFFPMEIAIE
jgi:hypothetical protein